MTEQLNNNKVITVTSWFKDFCLQKLLHYILIQMKWAGKKGHNRFLINQVTGRSHTSFWCCCCCCCCCSVTKLSPTLSDHTACSTAGLPALTISWCFPKFMSIKSVMPSNHLILCLPLLHLPSNFSIIRVFSMSWLFTPRGQCIVASASASVPPMSIQGWFGLGLTGWISL